MNAPMTRGDQRSVAAWLLVCAAFVFAMVVVGGITRLTHSGLSIVEWQPLIGTLPPVSDADWQELFDKYKQTPEYKHVNRGMSLEGFQDIFWWEYVHRLLGRLTGLVFLLPFLWFLFRRKLDSPLAWKLAGVFVLGAMQGAMGWYMVKSGLVDNPRVSHFRLTAHLGLALLIFVAEVWLALGLLMKDAPRVAKAAGLAAAVAALVFLQSLTGGFVAGLRAGLAYNTFPLMNGRWIPEEWLMLEPWTQNFLYNMATVQLVHRTLAWLLLALIAVLWWRLRGTPAQRAATALLHAMVAQFVLGIATLVLRVPIPLAALHQAGAVLVLGCALWTAYAARQR